MTEKERKEITMHAMRGYYMHAGFRELIEALRGVRSHHEFYNGSGYPEGLARGEIPLIERIIAIADAYDVVASERPYRKAMRKEEAMRELKNCAGSQFDPVIVTVFITILTKETKEK